MKNTLWFCVAAALLAAPAYGINKCTLPDGRVVYSDLACPTASKVSEVEPPSYMPPRYRWPASQMARKKALEPWIKSEWSGQIARRTISIGMPAALARLIWGEPDDINRTTTHNGTREQWVYGATGARNYVYIERDAVVAIQN